MFSSRFLRRIRRFRWLGVFLVPCGVVYCLLVLVEQVEQKKQRTGSGYQVAKTFLQDRSLLEEIEENRELLLSRWVEAQPTVLRLEDLQGYESRMPEVSKGSALVSTVDEVGAAVTPPEITEEKPADVKAQGDKPVKFPTSEGSYTVTLASFRKKTNADRFVQELNETGLEAFQWEIELPRKGRWHRVSTGNFVNARRARVFAKRLEQRGYDGFVTKIPISP